MFLVKSEVRSRKSEIRSDKSRVDVETIFKLEVKVINYLFNNDYYFILHIFTLIT